jgi:hypothetical protein
MELTMLWSTDNRNGALRRVFTGMVVLSVLAVQTAAALADEKPIDETESARAQRAARLVKMKSLAAQFEIKESPAGDKHAFELRPEPIFRYSDQPRGFVDATLWSWAPPGSTGRPAAIAKVEAAKTQANVPFWHFCVVSLDDELITADFEGVRRLAATKPGLELRSIPNAPEAAEKPATRQRQMKDLVARFAATIFNTNPDTKRPEPQEMRLLATPIHRYADEANGLQDGMIFSLTTNGTNPDMLVVIELRGAKNSSAEWKYGIVKMTIAEVHVRHDSQEVWMSPRNSPRETWDSFSKMPRDE